MKPISPSVKPPLKWAGGKRWLVPRLLELWGTEHQHRRLVEPCVGGMSVALGLHPHRALLNDANPHLINFYNWIKRGLSVSIPMENDSDCYYNHRKHFNDLVKTGKANSAESAQLFYYLNRTGFNGLCRFNRRNEFNVPFGRYQTINYKRDFAEYVNVLSNWQFQTRDFTDIQLELDDFIYADPPYDTEFTQYSSHPFDWSDQVRLAEWLAKHPGTVVLSNQATDRILDLYKQLGFCIKLVDAPRRISCNGDRSPVCEVIAMRGFE
jgi:DNA adenine methylase